jgi:glutamate-1-semialdehyde aminotransferase
VSLTTPARGGRPVLDPARLAFLTAQEEQRFLADRPRSRALLERARAHMPGGVPMGWMTAMHGHAPIFAAEGDGAWFTDIDGHRYLDMNQADLSMNVGFGPPAVVAAVADRMRRGSQFMLPTEDAVWCAEALAERWDLPYWQFTLSASGANAEIIRLARHASGRDKILMFDGKYHGHIEDSLVIMADGKVKPELHGLTPDHAAHARMVPFNDLNAVERALKPRDVALCIVEPALTNVGVVLPDEGFHAGLRELTGHYGTFLALDETHTQIASPGGLKQLWQLEADAVGLGKTIGGGVPIGAYGLSEVLAQPLKTPPSMPGAPMESVGGVATGGTLYGNALSLAACRAALSQVLTPQGFARTAALGTQLADGLAGLFAAASLDWQVHRLTSRSGFTFADHLPRNAAEARALAQPARYRLLRLWMANREVWESVATAGPTVSFAMAEAEVAFYLERMRDFLADIL